MSSQNRRVLPLLFSGLLLAFIDCIWAQDYGSRLGVQRGGVVSYEPRGPGVLFGALDPTVKRWYVPQELYNEYKWRNWEYTNYARESYQRYVGTALEGDYFYDVYGNPVTRGWLIYDAQKQQPYERGSTVFKDPNRYSSWFNTVLISSDQKGQFHYAVTIGDAVRTTLTPLTFSKPIFNGIQADFATDKYYSTILLSRISSPSQVGSTTGGAPVGTTNTTDLMAGHFTAQVGDFITVGSTYVNAHHSNTLLESFVGGRVKGNLTQAQKETPISFLEIILEDDSPEDGEGGAALFSAKITITAMDLESGKKREIKGNDIGFRPVIEGGFSKEGFLSADGVERITIRYDFSERSYAGPDPQEIVDVNFELVLANDYKVSVLSDRQTAGFTGNELHPLLVARADGNVKDTSNQRVLSFDYGLPTSNQIFSMHLRAPDLMGFNIYGEYAINHQFRLFPNPNLEENHEAASERADAWVLNVAKIAYPWFAYGEAFSMESRYASNILLTETDGTIDYSNENLLYEFVDDNDDQDRTPDWSRRLQGGPDISVFPGWDENNDFINDFNQNDNETRENLLPDCEEPFLRYFSDRPEFLFGIDLNNNGWIDRFENDEEPDFPYKRDHRGYNVYAGTHLGPETRLTIGRSRQWLLSRAKRSVTNYGLISFDRDFPGFGRVRIFEHLKRVRDNIEDDRLAPVPYFRGPQPRVLDELGAQDTWYNVAWFGFDYTGIPSLKVENKFKYELYHQNLSSEFLAEQGEAGVREDSYFLGLINKAEYSFRLGPMEFEPRIKSEFLRHRPYLVNNNLPNGGQLKQWRPSIFLWAQLPLMPNTRLEAGLEQTFSWELLTPEALSDAADPNFVGLEVGAPTGDFRETIFALQTTNITDYLGYKLVTQIGIQRERRIEENFWDAENTGDFANFGEDEKSTGFTTFITVYAGLDP